jgi:hypothetical protein
MPKRCQKPEKKCSVTKSCVDIVDDLMVYPENLRSNNGRNSYRCKRGYRVCPDRRCYETFKNPETGNRSAPTPKTRRVRKPKTAAEKAATKARNAAERARKQTENAAKRARSEADRAARNAQRAERSSAEMARVEQQRIRLEQQKARERAELEQANRERAEKYEKEYAARMQTEEGRNKAARFREKENEMAKLKAARERKENMKHIAQLLREGAFKEPNLSKVKQQLDAYHEELRGQNKVVPAETVVDLPDVEPVQRSESPSPPADGIVTSLPNLNDMVQLTAEIETDITTRRRNDTLARRKELVLDFIEWLRSWLSYKLQINKEIITVKGGDVLQMLLLNYGYQYGKRPEVVVDQLQDELEEILNRKQLWNKTDILHNTINQLFDVVESSVYNLKEVQRPRDGEQVSLKQFLKMDTFPKVIDFFRNPKSIREESTHDRVTLMTKFISWFRTWLSAQFGINRDLVTVKPDDTLEDVLEKYNKSNREADIVHAEHALEHELKDTNPKHWEDNYKKGRPILKFPIRQLFALETMDYRAN